jgi:hypothetical protein
MGSLFIPAAQNITRPSQRRPWALPVRGLALFHGHPDAPRLSHYFLPRLIAEGKRVLCLDGANRFDPLLIARFARRAGKASSAYHQNIRVARAFTCFQLTELLVRVPRLLQKFPAQALIVTALPELYFDEDVREREAEVAFREALEALKSHARARLPVAVFSDAAQFRTPRQKFFQLLVAQADEVWRFSEQEDGKLQLLEEKALPLTQGKNWRAPRLLPRGV